MTTLILMRHGHVEGINPERFRGRAELPLSPLGERQAHVLAQRVAARFSPVALYTSPMGRSIATGAPIAQALNLSSKVLNGLHDLDYGQWQGLTHEAVSERWPTLYQAWYNSPHLMRFPDGESLQDLVARTADGLRTVLERHPNKSDVVLLIGHDSVNRALLLQLLDQPLSAYWRVAQSPCCINHIDIHDGKITIRCINDTAHLEELPTN
ncbi:histidine phosphatase family protein [Pollutimonas bauzanensis]|uniref:Probable phosphoglycerate mutase n=1 Tax=Pollutimonas bauzanensis TaxID=658167 RepID=A0A1M6ASU4_9BURK|nr:histidine phosphatase family protein [Pollutimonas bauzanensis]SHI06072.1 probable phosphoglycerate mutase [Pollutimonas bauzanensis]SHI39507.1 probable phosphoglycerate mutase [Pollutimonas bauzanensis]